MRLDGTQIDVQLGINEVQVACRSAQRLLPCMIPHIGSDYDDRRNDYAL